MKILKGRFTRHDDTPAAGATLELRLSQDAKAEDGSEVKGDVPLYEITLDEHGAIPAGTRIHANDELDPHTACYDVTLSDNDSQARQYCEWLRIEGSSPINLNKLTPLEKAPDYVEPQPDPVPERPQVTREPGSSASYGFFGVSVHLPARTGSTPLPVLDMGTFGVCGFTLPCNAVVMCASIIVDSPERGKECVLALYDGDGKRALTTRISVENSGVATGYLDSPVRLSAGDYRLAWAIDHHSHATLRSIDVNRDLFGLVNAGVARQCVPSRWASLGSLRAIHEHVGGPGLPETLGEITHSRVVVPVVFFEA